MASFGGWWQSYESCGPHQSLISPTPHGLGDNTALLIYCCAILLIFYGLQIHAFYLLPFLKNFLLLNSTTHQTYQIIIKVASFGYEIRCKTYKLNPSESDSQLRKWIWIMKDRLRILDKFLIIRMYCRILLLFGTVYPSHRVDPPPACCHFQLCT